MRSQQWNSWAGTQHPLIEKPIKAVQDQYSERRNSAEISSRKDAIMLAQPRSRHSNLLRAYRHVIDPLVDPTCPKCVEGQHTLEHWFIECPALATTRLSGPQMYLWTSSLSNQPSPSRWQRCLYEAPLACMPAHNSSCTAAEISPNSNLLPQKICPSLLKHTPIRI